MELKELVAQLISERSIDHQTVLQYCRSVKCFEAFLGKTATIDDLDEPKVNAWLAQLERIGKTPTTVHNRKRGMTAIWNYASERQLRRYYERRRLRKTRATRPIVVARSSDEVAVMMQAAERVEGFLHCGLAASRMLKARVIVGFETGMRAGDLIRLKWTSIDTSSGRIEFIQRKVKRPHVVLIDAYACALLEDIRRPNIDRPFPLGKGGMRYWEQRLFEAAKPLGVNKRRREGLGALRKAYGTATAHVHGIEAAARGLGHAPSTGTTVAKLHYVEAEAFSKPIPPPTVRQFHGRSHRKGNAG